MLERLRAADKRGVESRDPKDRAVVSRAKPLLVTRVRAALDGVAWSY
jgi:hypothetical protein